MKGGETEMWRSKKLIISVVLAGVMLIGSIGGVAYANDDNEGIQPGTFFGAFWEGVCEIYKDKTGDDIDPEAIKESFNQARGEMQAEYPIGGPHHGAMSQLFESLGVDQETVQVAIEQACAEMKDGTLEGGRGAVMARVLEILKIDEADWQSACAETQKTHRFGFKGHGRFNSLGGIPDFGGSCAPLE